MLFVLIAIAILLLVVWICLMQLPVGIRRNAWGVPVPSDESSLLYRRRLGLLERWYVATSRCDNTINFSMVVELETAPESSSTTGRTLDCRVAVERALHRVIRRFPWLRTRVRRTGVWGRDRRSLLVPIAPTKEQGISSSSKSWIWGDDLYLEVSTSSDQTRIPLRTVEMPADTANSETWGEASGLRPILEQEAGLPWHDEDPDAPLTRAVLVMRPEGHRCAVILSFHHLITDGMGATAVIRALLEELRAGDTSPSSTTSEDNDVAQETSISDELPPPLEDLMDAVPRGRHALVPFLMDRFPFLRPWLEPPFWPGAFLTHPCDSVDDVAPVVRSSEMVCVPVLSDPKQVQQLRHWCRTQGITVNDFCLAAFGEALAGVVQPSPAPSSIPAKNSWPPQQLRLKIVLIVSVRQSCQLDVAQLGNYLSAPVLWLRLPSRTSSRAGDRRTEFDSVLRLARHLHQSVSRARPHLAKEIGLLSLVREDWLHFCLSRARSHDIPESIGWSNLGQVDLDEDHNDDRHSGGWKLTRAWFAQSRRGVGSAVVVTIVSTPTGGLNAVLSALPQVVSRPQLLEIGHAWQSVIVQAVAAAAPPRSWTRKEHGLGSKME